ncbi:MAG: UvrD-helicase domain-containing protein [Synechococcus sp.]|nr:UvrD-helicase domain-containing protein [Synechococcus sp.]
MSAAGGARRDRAGSAGAAATAGPAAVGELDANTLDLAPGIRLLEASAGTGKTFALAHLVLRLVSEAELALPRILVVTFSEAAAAELRDRIGRRLQQGLALLESGQPGAATAVASPQEPPALRPDPGPDPSDEVLLTWYRRCRALPSERRERLRVQLLLALEDLAAADITTIHGFCRRTLQREALAAGRSPQLQLEDPDDATITELVHAYWQQQVVPLPPPLLAGLRRCGLDPAALEALLRSLDGDPALELDPLPAGIRLEASLPDQLPAFWQGCWDQFRSLWQVHGRALQNQLQAQAGRWRAQGHTRTDPYRPSARTDRCAELDAFLAAQPPQGDYEACLGQDLLSKYYHPGCFCKVARSLEQHREAVVPLPDPALMQAVARLLDGPAEAVLLHALHWGRRELEQRRRRRRLSSFSQLLRDLDPGPDPATASPLLEAVAARYGAALIDEFQDTDPIQWRILRRAFGRGCHRLVMVGDPKQAIYRFRGGDLDTYRAAADQADERWALTGNRRSSPELIEALNRLMRPGLRRSELVVPPLQAHSDRRGPQGAAIELLWLGHPGDDPAAAGEEGPPGGDVEESAARADAAAAGSHRHPARTALEAYLPARIAAHLRQLLDAGLELEQGDRRRPLVATDVALLVNNHRQAEALRRALERHGIASRLVSRADVFLSPAAIALQRCLDALADPADDNRLRLLAASPLLAWSAARIAAAPAVVWGDLAERLANLARQLPQRGLLGVLADLLGAEGMARLERAGRLAADLQQVGALVQQRLHADGLAPAALADWLRRRRLDPPQQLNEDHQIHSDRADGAVAVITVHRSKGLEFPLVICPYLWQSAAAAAPTSLGRRWHPPGAAGPVLDVHRNRSWGPGYAADRQQRLEEEKERERLAYVALTRAQHRLVLAWGPARGQQAAPLLPWLFPDEPPADLDDDRLARAAAEHWRQRLEQAIAADRLPLALITAPDPPPIPVAGPPEPSSGPQLSRGLPLSTGPVPQRRFDPRWGRSSYSRWVHGQVDGAAAFQPPEALEEGRDTGDATPEPLSDPDPEARVERPGPVAPLAAPVPACDDAPGATDSPWVWPQIGPLAAFPAGPRAGDCLHRILERFAFDQPATAPANRRLAEQELRRSGLTAADPAALLEGLENLRLTPFGGELAGLRPADLRAGHRLSEMRFDLSLGFAEARRLAAAFRDWPGGAFGAVYSERLAQLPIAHRGFLTGSIDLIFPVVDAAGDQRWWVLDWKSNRLGRRENEQGPWLCGPRHYGREAMVQLMVASHYPLQAHLYLVALHRYLRWRLPGYAPQRHLGGYVYAFLRGVPGEAGARALPGAVPGMLVDCPPLERLLALDAALGCAGEADATGLRRTP